jgi:hypothetical protein
MRLTLDAIVILTLSVVGVALERPSSTRRSRSQRMLEVSRFK